MTVSTVIREKVGESSALGSILVQNGLIWFLPVFVVESFLSVIILPPFLQDTLPKAMDFSYQGMLDSVVRFEGTQVQSLLCLITGV